MRQRGLSGGGYGAMSIHSQPLQKAGPEVSIRKPLPRRCMWPRNDDLARIKVRVGVIEQRMNNNSLGIAGKGELDINVDNERIHRARCSHCDMRIVHHAAELSQ